MINKKDYPEFAYVPMKYLPSPFNFIILGMALRYTNHTPRRSVETIGMTQAFIYSLIVRDEALSANDAHSYLQFVIAFSRMNPDISDEELRLLLPITLGLRNDVFDKLIDSLTKEYVNQGSVTIQLTL